MIFHEGKRDLCDSTGRRILLDWLRVSYSYLGVIEGHPGYINRRILSELPDKMAELLGGVPFVVVPVALEEGQPLPTYQFIASFTSMEGVSGRAGFGSSLGVAWFRDDIQEPLESILNATLSRIDWDRHAGEFDWADL